jgi:hypothetical protein
MCGKKKTKQKKKQIGFFGFWFCREEAFKQKQIYFWV